jgi:hypothetical protein
MSRSVPFNTNYVDDRSDDSDALVLKLIHETCCSFLIYDILICLLYVLFSFFLSVFFFFF